MCDGNINLASYSSHKFRIFSKSTSYTCLKNYHHNIIYNELEKFQLLLGVFCLLSTSTTFHFNFHSFLIPYIFLYMDNFVSVKLALSIL